MISSFSVSAEREKVIDFSRPYGQILIVIAAPADMKVSGYGDLAGKRVVVTRGTTADKALDRKRQGHRDRALRTTTPL